MPKAALLLVVCLIAVTGCAGRWRANMPRQIAATDPQGAFEVALATVRAEGYQVVDLDPARGFFRVKSKIDGDMRGHVGFFGSVSLVERVTYLAFQVLPPAVMTISATGYHVRENNIHARVAEEVDRLAACIQSRTGTAPLSMLR
ncbi:MAG TPA: hypothetical protein VMZ28_27005 [Kofleriaceae bacterium]|nr:hypothetical protein [Kofleriaceae bacterium]